MNLKKLHLRPEFWAALIILILGIFHTLKGWQVSLDDLTQTYWPLIFVLGGIFQLFSRRYSDTSSALVLILLGLGLLFYKIGFFHPEAIRDDLLQFIKSSLNKIAT